MATISRTKASLRIFGDELNPDEVTKLLGGSPTKTQFKGEEIPLRKEGKFRVAITGGWWLQSGESEPSNYQDTQDFLPFPHEKADSL
jgi:uncharacterized protein DUF4279